MTRHETKIEWTHAEGFVGATLNPWTGCTKVSPGCANCYISRTPPFRTTGRDWDYGKIPLVFHMERLEKMIRKTKPTMYFVNSLSDLFHEDAHDQQIADVFTAMARAPHHTFQILTKRPSRMRKLLGGAWIAQEVDANLQAYGLPSTSWPLPNVWMGVTIENRQFVGRANMLRETPAAVRFISAEPLLGPLVERVTHGRHCLCSACARQDWAEPRLAPCGMHGSSCPARYSPIRSLDLTDIDWLICGGESGPGFRRFDLQWARKLRDACGEFETAFFLKQLGGPRSGSALEDLPVDLRIREYPRVAERVVEGVLF